MKKKNVLDLVTSVDVLNTLSGGISEPNISYYEYELAREIRLRVPGIDKELMHVEVHNNHLTIYYFINVLSTDKLVQIPQIVHSRSVPYYIDISKINAIYEGNELVVRLPFNKLANGYHKKIHIDKD